MSYKKEIGTKKRGVILYNLTNEILFLKEIYASPCMEGAIVYLILNYLGLERDANMLISIGIIVALRVIAGSLSEFAEGGLEGFMICD